MSAQFTQLHLEIVLHYHVSPEPFPRENSCIAEYRSHLIADGLVEEESSQFRITDKGKVFVEMLCSTPLPTSKTI